MIESFCTTLLLHFSKRFSIANIHFSSEIALMILHFFYLPVSTFSAAAQQQLFSEATCSATTLLYPVLIYTPIKVKSELREKRDGSAKQTSQFDEVHQWHYLFFFWLQNLRDCILLLVDISWWKSHFIFVPSQRIENRWTSDGKMEFSHWFWFKWKVRQNGRFWAWKTSEKGLFYRLNSNLFIFKQFDMLHRQVNTWLSNS